MPCICFSAEYQNTNTTSEFIKDASISISGSTVEITCELSEDYPESSCVLVYREYGNTTLVVVEYTRNRPSDNIVLDNPDSNYTFAIFGKNGNAGIDPIPVANKRYMYAVATTATTTEEPAVIGPQLSSKISSRFLYVIIYMYNGHTYIDVLCMLLLHAHTHCIYTCIYYTYYIALDDKSQTGPVIGAVIAGVMVIVIIACGIVITVFMRKRGRGKVSCLFN